MTTSVWKSTLWTLVEDAGRGDNAAMDRFVERYRPAILRYIVCSGVSPIEAEDAAQEVLLAIVRGGLLARLKRTGGKFRSYLIGVTKNVLGNQLKRERALKRDGKRADILPGDAAPAADPDVGPCLDETFDHAWVMTLLSLAFDRLREESRRRGTPYAAALEQVIDHGCDYRSAAALLGKSENDVRNYVRRARELLAKYMRELIADYCLDHAEYERERAYVDRLLKQVKHEVPERE